MFPRSVIRRVRLAVDKWTMPTKEVPRSPLSDAELAYAERRLGPDREWVDQLFGTRTIQLGDGRPFVATSAAQQAVRPQSPDGTPLKSRNGVVR